MPLDLPALVLDYIRAQDEQDAAGFASCFGVDAVLYDEPEDTLVEGRSAIESWAAETFAKTKLTTEPLAFEGDQAASILTCRVSGSFPGSPLLFHHHLDVRDDRFHKVIIHLGPPQADTPA